MKTRKLIIFSLCLLSISTSKPLFCQSWIGDNFELDTSITLSYAKMPSDLNHLLCNIQNNILFFTEQRAFQKADNGYAAHILAFSLLDFTSFEFDLPFPPSIKRKELVANSFWINDLGLYGNRFAVSVQNQILLYRRTPNNHFEFDTLIEHPNVKASYLYNDQLYYLEEDHDVGYKWYTFDFKNKEELFVRGLTYEAPHVVQALPNRYLFRDENNLYFLSTRYPSLSKYSLDGTWIQDTHFDLPFWHPFEDEYINKSMQVPYGVERIYATKDQIFNYSYLKTILPLGDRYLIYYTQYDTCLKKSSPMFAISDSLGHTMLYNQKCPTDFIFSGKKFPFNLFETYEDLGRISWFDCLVEITADCGISWMNQTQEEYRRFKESHYRQHDPILKLRIMRLHDTNYESQPFFYNTDREFLSLDNLPSGKHLFIIHNGLECSACSHYLLQSMNSLDSGQVHLGILQAFVPGALRERETHREIRQYLDRPYDLYFLATDLMAQYPRFISQRASRFPAVLFYETGRAPILFSNEDIFADDQYTLQFSKEFLKVLDRFKAK